MNEQKNEEIQKELNEITREAMPYCIRVIEYGGLGIFGMVCGFLHNQHWDRQISDILIILSLVVFFKVFDYTPFFAELKKRTKELKSKMEH